MRRPRGSSRKSSARAAACRTGPAWSAFDVTVVQRVRRRASEALRHKMYTYFCTYVTRSARKNEVGRTPFIRSTAQDSRVGGRDTESLHRITRRRPQPTSRGNDGTARCFRFGTGSGTGFSAKVRTRRSGRRQNCDSSSPCLFTGCKFEIGIVLASRSTIAERSLRSRVS